MKPLRQSRDRYLTLARRLAARSFGHDRFEVESATRACHRPCETPILEGTMTISFEDRVAIVTGAGGGLGRTYALELARRGAKVVVNDLGGSRDGTGHSDAALKVVEEIEAAGGAAMSNGASVTEYEQMVEMVAKAKEAWGGVHILINNAGILRDKSFAKMSPDDF